MSTPDDSIIATYRSAIVSFFMHIHWLLIALIIPVVIYFGTTSYFFGPSIENMPIDYTQMTGNIFKEMGVNFLSSALFDPLLLSLAIVMTKKDTTQPNFFSTVLKSYLRLFLPYFVWITMITISNILVIPGLMLSLATLIMVNPIRWLEEGKSAIYAPSAPWLSFLFPGFMFLIWFVYMQFLTLIVMNTHGDYPYLCILLKLIDRLLWVFFLVLSSQIWRLGIPRNPTKKS